MSETAVLEGRGSAKGTRWSPRKFARAYVEGKTLAECAKIAGSKAVTENALHVAGCRWQAHPRVTALLLEVEPLLHAGWAGGVQRLAEMARMAPGPNGTPTNIDAQNATLAIGRALGKFVQRIEVTHLAPIGYRRLFDAEAIQGAITGQACIPAPSAAPALPAAGVTSLDTAGLETLLASVQAELAKRKAVDVASPPVTDAPQAVTREM